MFRKEFFTILYGFLRGCQIGTYLPVDSFEQVIPH